MTGELFTGIEPGSIEVFAVGETARGIIPPLEKEPPVP
jgi:hypothetical protein